jgi:hypothetical protein
MTRRASAPIGRRSGNRHRSLRFRFGNLWSELSSAVGDLLGLLEPEGWGRPRGQRLIPVPVANRRHGRAGDGTEQRANIDRWRCWATRDLSAASLNRPCSLPRRPWENDGPGRG